MSKSNELDRRNVVARLLADRKDAVVVPGLGSSNYDIAAAGDHDRNFYNWGAMGGAAMIGLGIALAQPKVPVIVITGDGEMLMGMGGLATIALKNPGNLSVIALDNGHYGETGGQKSHTSGRTDLSIIATGCGIADVRTITTMAEVEKLAERINRVGDGPVFATVKVSNDELPRILPQRDATFLKNRVRIALGHEVI
jgi:thiamine pyrophosphate-dependent acetolactate synthase large subunit-like protein